MKKLDENYFVGDIVENQSVESFLGNGELILWTGRPKKMAYVLGKSLKMMPIGIIWGFIDFTILFFIFASGDVPLEMLFIVVPFFALHLTPFWIWLGSLIKASKEQKTIEYVITNERFLIFKGKVRHIADSINIRDLVDATLRINFIDRLLGVGDITIYSVERDAHISDIPKSEFLHSKILALCNNQEENYNEFYDDKIECPHCGTFFDVKEIRCPSCGSPNKPQ